MAKNVERKQFGSYELGMRLSTFFYVVVFRCVSISITAKLTDKQTNSHIFSFVQNRLGQDQSGQVRRGDLRI